MPSVTRQSNGQRERRTASASKILSAAESLLAGGERFTELPVERLISEAQVSRPTFYAHFADKSALLARLAEQVIDQLQGAADDWWAHPHTDDPGPVVPTLLEMTRVMRENAALLRAIFEVSGYDDDVARRWRLRTESFIATSAARLAEEQKAGLVAKDVDVQQAAAQVVRLVEGALYQQVLHGDPDDDLRVVTSLARSGWLIKYGQVPTSAVKKR